MSVTSVKTQLFHGYRSFLKQHNRLSTQSEMALSLTPALFIVSLGMTSHGQRSELMKRQQQKHLVNGILRKEDRLNRWTVHTRVMILVEQCSYSR